MCKTPISQTCNQAQRLRNFRRNGQAEWVNVKKGAVDGTLVEVIGNLKPGDRVLKRATDEVREGTKIRTRAPKGG